MVARPKRLIIRAEGDCDPSPCHNPLFEQYPFINDPYRVVPSVWPEAPGNIDPPPLPTKHSRRWYSEIMNNMIKMNNLDAAIPIRAPKSCKLLTPAEELSTSPLGTARHIKLPNLTDTDPGSPSKIQFELPPPTEGLDKPIPFYYKAFEREMAEEETPRPQISEGSKVEATKVKPISCTHATAREDFDNSNTRQHGDKFVSGLSLSDDEALLDGVKETALYIARNFGEWISTTFFQSNPSENKIVLEPLKAPIRSEVAAMNRSRNDMSGVSRSQVLENKTKNSSTQYNANNFSRIIESRFDEQPRKQLESNMSSLTKSIFMQNACKKKVLNDKKNSDFQSNNNVTHSQTNFLKVQSGQKHSGPQQTSSDLSTNAISIQHSSLPDNAIGSNLLEMEFSTTFWKERTIKAYKAYMPQPSIWQKFWHSVDPRTHEELRKRHARKLIRAGHRTVTRQLCNPQLKGTFLRNLMILDVNRGFWRFAANSHIELTLFSVENVPYISQVIIETAGLRLNMPFNCRFLRLPYVDDNQIVRIWLTSPVGISQRNTFVRTVPGMEHLAQDWIGDQSRDEDIVEIDDYGDVDYRPGFGGSPNNVDEEALTEEDIQKLTDSIIHPNSISYKQAPTGCYNPAPDYRTYFLFDIPVISLKSEEGVIEDAALLDPKGFFSLNPEDEEATPHDTFIKLREGVRENSRDPVIKFRAKLNMQGPMKLLTTGDSDPPHSVSITSQEGLSQHTVYVACITDDFDRFVGHELNRNGQRLMKNLDSDSIYRLHKGKYVIHGIEVNVTPEYITPESHPNFNFTEYPHITGRQFALGQVVLPIVHCDGIIQPLPDFLRKNRLNQKLIHAKQENEDMILNAVKDEHIVPKIIMAEVQYPETARLDTAAIVTLRKHADAILANMTLRYLATQQDTMSLPDFHVQNLKPPTIQYEGERSRIPSTFIWGLPDQNNGKPLLLPYNLCQKITTDQYFVDVLTPYKAGNLSKKYQPSYLNDSNSMSLSGIVPHKPSIHRPISSTPPSDSFIAQKDAPNCCQTLPSLNVSNNSQKFQSPSFNSCGNTQIDRNATTASSIVNNSFSKNRTGESSLQSLASQCPMSQIPASQTPALHHSVSQTPASHHSASHTLASQCPTSQMQLSEGVFASREFLDCQKLEDSVKLIKKHPQNYIQTENILRENNGADSVGHNISENFKEKILSSNPISSRSTNAAESKVKWRACNPWNPACLTKSIGQDCPLPSWAAYLKDGLLRFDFPLPAEPTRCIASPMWELFWREEVENRLRMIRMAADKSLPSDMTEHRDFMIKRVNSIPPVHVLAMTDFDLLKKYRIYEIDPDFYPAWISGMWSLAHDEHEKWRDISGLNCTALYHEFLKPSLSETMKLDLGFTAPDPLHWSSVVRSCNYTTLQYLAAGHNLHSIPKDVVEKDPFGIPAFGFKAKDDIAPLIEDFHELSPKVTPLKVSQSYLKRVLEEGVEQERQRLSRSGVSPENTAPSVSIRINKNVISAKSRCPSKIAAPSKSVIMKKSISSIEPKPSPKIVPKHFNSVVADRDVGRVTTPVKPFTPSASVVADEGVTSTIASKTSFPVPMTPFNSVVADRGIPTTIESKAPFPVRTTPLNSVVADRDMATTGSKVLFRAPPGHVVVAPRSQIYDVQSDPLNRKPFVCPETSLESSCNRTALERQGLNAPSESDTISSSSLPSTVSSNFSTPRESRPWLPDEKVQHRWKINPYWQQDRSAEEVARFRRALVKEQKLNKAVKSRFTGEPLGVKYHLLSKDGTLSFVPDPPAPSINNLEMMMPAERIRVKTRREQMVTEFLLENSREEWRNSPTCKDLLPKLEEAQLIFDNDDVE